MNRGRIIVFYNSALLKWKGISQHVHADFVPVRGLGTAVLQIDIVLNYLIPTSPSDLDD
jgi:hypothetical protein